MILGLGVDLVHLPRLASLLKRRGTRRLASRILSQDEHLEWKSLDDRHIVRFLAVRWGVKEAAYKALYPTVSPTWKELTYRGSNEERGVKPTLKYHPFLPYESRKVGRIHVSVSHDGNYVLATVLVEGVEGE